MLNDGLNKVHQALVVPEGGEADIVWSPPLPVPHTPSPPLTASPPVFRAVSWKVPKENDAALNRFYGQRSPNMKTEWFNFPEGCPPPRLYERDGDLLTDHDRDTLRLPDHKCHPLLVRQVEGALSELLRVLGVDEFVRQGWHLYCGCHNYRPKTGTTSKSYSTHAWAIALDFNAMENPYGKAKTSFSDVAFDIWEKWGFLCGWRAWGHDAMHVQAAIPLVKKGSYYHEHGFPENIQMVA